MMYTLGLDFGGTKLAAGVCNGDVLLASSQCPTPAHAAASLAAMRELARTVLMQADVTAVGAVGVSFGGPVQPDGRTTRLSMHVPGWEDFPLAAAIEQTLGVPCAVANDGDAGALAEHGYGAGRGAQTLLYLTASTGIGGGVIINGHLHRGARAYAGEIGHMLLDAAGPACPCGRNGCLESLASGLSIARDARQTLRHLNSANPAQISARDVALAAAHDPAAQAVWHAAMTWIGYGIASAANLINPDVVVVGGGLTAAGAQFFEPVRQAAAARAMDPELRIIPAALGAWTGVYGGAAVAQAFLHP